MIGSGIVWDNHACLPFTDTEQRLPEIARYRKAGVDAATINIDDSHVPLDVLTRMAAMHPALRPESSRRICAWPDHRRPS